MIEKAKQTIEKREGSIFTPPAASTSTKLSKPLTRQTKGIIVLFVPSRQIHSRKAQCQKNSTASLSVSTIFVSNKQLGSEQDLKEKIHTLERKFFDYK